MIPLKADRPQFCKARCRLLGSPLPLPEAHSSLRGHAARNRGPSLMTMTMPSRPANKHDTLAMWATIVKDLERRSIDLPGCFRDCFPYLYWAAQYRSQKTVRRALVAVVVAERYGGGAGPANPAIARGDGQLNLDQESFCVVNGGVRTGNCSKQRGYKGPARGEFGRGRRACAVPAGPPREHQWEAQGVDSM